MVSVFPDLKSVENANVDTSDMVGLVLEALEVERFVISSGDDVPWDTVCAGVEPLWEVEKRDVVTSVSVV